MFDRVIITKTDFILPGSVLLVAGLLLCFLQLTAHQGSWVVVSFHGEEYGRYSLNEDARIPLQNARGEGNLLIIEDETARIEEADCPDGLCVQQGRISRGGESIICLPHELVISVSSSDGFRIFPSSENEAASGNRAGSGNTDTDSLDAVVK